MNAQQQDALRILTSRGPMTSRALFDIMQDELGYWGYAVTHDQRQAAIEALSKILSKMKAENIIDGELTPQEKGRPVMLWSSSQPVVDKSDATESWTVHPPESHEDDLISQTAEMASDIAEISQEQPAEYVVNHDAESRVESDLHIYVDTIKIQSGDTEEMCLSKTCGEYVYLNGDLMIRNLVELEVFTNTIGDLLRA